MNIGCEKMNCEIQEKCGGCAYGKKQYAQQLKDKIPKLWLGEELKIHISSAIRFLEYCQEEQKTLLRGIP